MKNFILNTMRSLSLALVAIVGVLMASTVVYAQTPGTIRKNELERVSISEIPLPGYDEPKPGDKPPPDVNYTYWAYIHEIRDTDTVKGQVDLGFNLSHWLGIRFYANDAFEITKKGGRSASHVARGFKCTALMVKWLGSEETFPEKATYHKFKTPIKVKVESHKADKYAGRWLFTVYNAKNQNLNQLAARSGCAIVTTFERNPVFYDRNTPITRDLR